MADSYNEEVAQINQESELERLIKMLTQQQLNAATAASSAPPTNTGGQPLPIGAGPMQSQVEAPAAAAAPRRTLGQYEQLGSMFSGIPSQSLSLGGSNLTANFNDDWLAQALNAGSANGATLGGGGSIGTGGKKGGSGDCDPNDLECICAKNPNDPRCGGGGGGAQYGNQTGLSNGGGGLNFGNVGNTGGGSFKGGGMPARDMSEFGGMFDNI